MPHTCRAVSANRYEVVYDGNGGSGYMVPSIHMYHDATVYEGREVTPQTTLSLCGFWRTGYRFAGWNTQPDGTGQEFADGERICDLSDQEGGRWCCMPSGTGQNRYFVLIPPGAVIRITEELPLYRGTMAAPAFWMIGC